MSSVSLVIPFFNEASCLRENLEETFTFLSGLGLEFEILLGNDGSTDESLKTAEAFALSHAENVRVVSHFPNEGKGSILTKCFLQAEKEILCFMDADLEIPLIFLKNVLDRLGDPQVEVVVGSKLTTRQDKVRAKHRHGASKVYNWLVHRILGSNVSDHQCGLKGFKKDVLKPILPDLREGSWTWDTEVLLLLQKKGVSVHEIEVELYPQRKSRVAFFPTIFFFLNRIWSFHRRGLGIGRT